MSYTGRRLWHRVWLNGTPVRTAGAVIQNERLEDLTTVAEFELAEQPEPEPADGDEVLIEWVDIDAALVYAQFGGTVAGSPEVESDPWRMIVRCVDQLDLLRNVRVGTDLDLTGMTDGEAWQAVADDCGVTYDPADIADAGYVLGERAPVYWHVDTPGSQIIGELDTVFGMATQTVGDNRVVRLHYDPTPTTATGLYATYTRGVSIDLGAHRRSGGGRERRQSIWIVRGVVADCDTSCTCQAWAKAVDATPRIGGANRLPPQTFQSDLMQDEAVVEAVARRFMRVNNRLPAEAGGALVNDPNVRPGSKIAVVDRTYGIDADPRYYLVAGVDRTGHRMDLTLVAGPPGTEGTVTSGVDKVCNALHTDLDWPGSFDFPAFDFPPLDLGFALDFDLNLPLDFGGLWDPGGWTKVDNSGEGGGPPPGPCDGLTGAALAECQAEDCDPGEEECGHDSIGQLSGWVEDGSLMSTGPNLRFDSFGAGHYGDLAIEAGRSWEMRVAFGLLRTPSGALADNFEFVVGVDAFDEWAAVMVAGTPGPGLTSDVLRLDVIGGGFTVDDGPPFPATGDDCLLVWAYDAGADEMTATLTFGANEYEAIASTVGASPDDPSFFGVRASMNAGSGDAIEITEWLFRYT